MADPSDWINLGIPPLAPKELKKMERLIKSDYFGYSFRGPLTSTRGKFNLDTPWPEAPPLFRFHFQWLWVEFDPSLVGIDQRPFVPFMYGVQPALVSGLVKLPWDWESLRKLSLLDCPSIEHLAALNDVADLFSHHFLFAVPKTPLTTRERDELATDFRNRVDRLADENGLATSKKRTPGLLGNPMEWRDFKWCRQYIQYPQESQNPMSSPDLDGHKEAIFKLWMRELRNAVKISQTSNPIASIRAGYTTIESLMLKIYPCFDWPGILNARLGVEEIVSRPTYLRGLEVCRRKLAVGFRQVWGG